MSIATPLTRAARFLHTGFDIDSATLTGGSWTERHLSDLRGLYADADALEARIAADDPVVYSVSSIEPEDGEGDLHFGLGRIMPGRVGEEFFMTKGHLHFWRPAAEVYIGLQGSGVMLLEDEDTSETKVIPLERGGIVYVPGHTAHRTVNVGSEPLVYLGVFPARAGHDYGVIAERGFRVRILDDGVGGWREERPRRG